MSGAARSFSLVSSSVESMMIAHSEASLFWTARLAAEASQ